MAQELPGVTLFPGGVEVVAEPGDQRGNRWPAEWVRYDDPLTGRRVTRFTSSRGTDQHPYFTGPAVTADGQHLVFISDRTGNPNIFALDMASGQIVQLTDNRYGVLRQYVFPWGNRTGLGKSSVVLHPGTGHVYFMQGRQVRRVHAGTGEQKAIAELPPGWVTAFTHVSADDRFLCVPLVPEEAFAESAEAGLATHGRSMLRTCARVRELGLMSELWVVATDGSSQSVWARQNSWITHVQFRPTESRYLLFNNEAIGEAPGGQRIWMCDGHTGNVWKIRPEPPDRRHWNCHEMWTADGSRILYHGTGLHPESGQWLNFFGFADLEGTHYQECFLKPDEARGYGHFAEHPTAGHVFCDGYYGDSKLITEVWPGEDGYARWRPVCRHDSKWIYQDDHPHPLYAPNPGILIYSSSAEGVGNVYGVEL